LLRAHASNTDLLVFQLLKYLYLLQRFHPEGIYIALVGIEVWTSGDLVNVNFADNDATLEEFCEYRKNNINPQHNNDNTQFIT